MSISRRVVQEIGGRDHDGKRDHRLLQVALRVRQGRSLDQNCRSHGRVSCPQNRGPRRRLRGDAIGTSKGARKPRPSEEGARGPGTWLAPLTSTMGHSETRRAGDVRWPRTSVWLTGLLLAWSSWGLPLDATAQGVAAPVLKWTRGGCQDTWCRTGWYASPAVADLDDDGRPEVIWSDYRIVVVRGEDGANRWTVNNPGEGAPGPIRSSWTSMATASWRSSRRTPTATSRCTGPTARRRPAGPGRPRVTNSEASPSATSTATATSRSPWRPP